MAIEVEDVDGVPLLRMSRPERGNALTPAMMVELADRIEQHGERRAIVLAGAGGRVFCSGYDLARLGEAHGDREAADWSARFPELTRLVQVLEDCPAPLVAAVNGHAIGGGALLALLCDLRVGQVGTRFQIPATRLGVLYPLEGIRRLVAVVGQGRALQLLLLGGPVFAEDAGDWGLFASVGDSLDCEQHALALARDLAERAPLAVRGLKALIRAVAVEGAPDSTEQLHRAWTERCLASADLAEGLTAMAERRPARFEGR